MVSALLMLAALAPQAAAEPLWSFLVDEDKHPLEWHCLDVSVVKDTVPYAVAAEARRSYARTYSAVNQLEDEVLPQLAMVDKGGLFRISFDAMFNVTQLPSIACGELATQGFDVSSYNMAFAARGKRLAVFYSAAGNSSIIWEGWPDRTIKHGGTFIVGHYYAASAPLWGARVINADQLDDNIFTEGYSSMASGDSLGGLSLDYIAGASLDLDYVVLGAGYVGSQGFYLHADQPHSGVFFDTITELGEARSDPLRYLKTGLRGFRWLLDADSELGQTLGASDADVSRYRIVSPTGTLYTQQDDVEVAPLAEDTFTRTTLRQRDLWGILDVQASYTLEPKWALYDGIVRVHTPQYHPDLIRKHAGRYRVDEGGAASLALGAVRLPERTYLAVRGGTKLYVAADMILYTGDEITDGHVKFQFLRNDPDTLAIFPYAQNAWSAHISFVIGS